MKFRNNLPSVQEEKNTDMIDYLSSLGFKPAKVSRNNYRYLSPFREETTPSFKVNRSLNQWYDFGEGNGGNIIDFGIVYHNCSVKELLTKFSNASSFQHQNHETDKGDEEAKKIKVIKEKELSYFVLLRYLHKRRIPVDIAKKFCREIEYELYDKNYYAIGFKNDAGGYELRNEKFKASSSPQDITLIKNNAEKITVFEGFFNFLSYQTIHQKQELPRTNFLILNSTSFFEKSLSLMQSYKSVHLYLDCDTTGQKCIQKALEIDKRKFIDESSLYKNYKDLNDWMMHIGQSKKQSLQLNSSLSFDSLLYMFCFKQ